MKIQNRIFNIYIYIRPTKSKTIYAGDLCLSIYIYIYIYIHPKRSKTKYAGDLYLSKMV